MYKTYFNNFTPDYYQKLLVCLSVCGQCAANGHTILANPDTARDLYSPRLKISLIIETETKGFETEIETQVFEAETET